MVKALASPPHRLLLFLQQSSVEWCSSLWLDAIRDIDPTFRRTVIVVSKFDNRLKVHKLTATGAWLCFHPEAFSVSCNLMVKSLQRVANRS